MYTYQCPPPTLILQLIISFHLCYYEELNTRHTSPLFFTNTNGAIKTKKVLKVFGKSCVVLFFRVGPTSIYTNLVFLTMLHDTSTIPIQTLLLLKKDLFGGEHFLCSKVNI